MCIRSLLLRHEGVVRALPRVDGVGVCVCVGWMALVGFEFALNFLFEFFFEFARVGLMLTRGEYRVGV